MNQPDGYITISTGYLIKILILFVSALAGFIYLFIKQYVKKVVESHFERKFLKFKTDLEEKTEVLKTKLGIYAYEQNVRATRFDEKRATAIETIYNSLIDVLSQISHAVAIPEKNLQETEVDFQSYYENLLRGLLDASNRYTNEIARHAIYLNDELHRQLKESATSIEKALYHIGGITKISDPERPPVLTPNRIRYDDMRNGFFQEYNEKLKKVKAELIKEFRAALGS